MWYELWDITSGNLISDFASEAEAVEAARAYVTPDSAGPTVDTSLVVYDDKGSMVLSLEGEVLVAWANPEIKKV